MSRYLGPKIKLIKKFGALPNLDTKKRFSNKKTKERQKNVKSYKLRLQETQKLKFNYGLNERQLFNIVKKARKKYGVTGLIILQLLETRIDTIIRALGFSVTIMQARQLVNHGHILINKKQVNKVNFQCSLQDLICFKTKNFSTKLMQFIKSFLSTEIIAEHLRIDRKLLRGKILNYCKRKNVKLQINELLVIEYYSRR